MISLLAAYVHLFYMGSLMFSYANMSIRKVGIVDIVAYEESSAQYTLMSLANVALEIRTGFTLASYFLNVPVRTETAGYMSFSLVIWQGTARVKYYSTDLLSAAHSQRMLFFGQ